LRFVYITIENVIPSSDVPTRITTGFCYYLNYKVSSVHYVIHCGTVVSDNGMWACPNFAILRVQTKIIAIASRDANEG